ncbi:phosphatidylserine decarboxylase [Desulfobacca acetoxidans]
MEAGLLILLGISVALAVGGYVFWRYVWFFRNPERDIPTKDVIVSPADGTVVYVKQVLPQEKIVAVKAGVELSINDITKNDLRTPKVLIGVFMSPLNVHYNRMPLAGEIEFIRHYPAQGANRHMGWMHLRTLLGRQPLYANSTHIFTNERTVTKFRSFFKNADLTGYIVQIAGGSVNGIDSYVSPGQRLNKGDIFGMIRIGSQVDLVLTWLPGMRLQVKPGDKVRAGESILIA